MKTNSEVEPALMNGSGSPVGGIEPVNTSCCTINFSLKKSKFIAPFFGSFLHSSSFIMREIFHYKICIG